MAIITARSWRGVGQLKDYRLNVKETHGQYTFVETSVLPRHDFYLRPFTYRIFVLPGYLPTDMTVTIYAFRGDQYIGEIPYYVPAGWDLRKELSIPQVLEIEEYLLDGEGDE